jgi:hypothetical protein
MKNDNAALISPLIIDATIAAGAASATAFVAQRTPSS